MTFKTLTYDERLAKNQRRREQQREQGKAKRTAPRPRQPRVFEALVESAMAFPKTQANRNPRLLALAKGRDCLLRIPGVCNNDTSTTVACHGNSSKFGKGGARKADDHYSVWGCAACHHWLDSSYVPTYAERQEAFNTALSRQLVAWKGLAACPNESHLDRDAARWALELHGRES